MIAAPIVFLAALAVRLTSRGPAFYTQVRTATDRYLGDADQSTYWSKLLPKLRDHFQVVRDLFGPRIRQSKWLKANS